MAELLVRTQSNVSADSVDDLKCWKRGMVIVAMPDGWAWGKEELSNPLFLIVKVPDMTLAAASAFLGNLIQAGRTDTVNPMRAFKLDLDNPVIATQIKADRTKENATLLSADVQALKVSVDLVNPLIIG